MEAHLEHYWPTRTVRVFLIQSYGPGKEVLQYEGDGKYSRVPIHEGMMQGGPIPPTFELPSDALEAIVAAAGDFLPPSAATDRHLKDTIEVRDRLLSVIEGLIP